MQYIRRTSPSMHQFYIPRIPPCNRSVHISVIKRHIAGHSCNALWDLWDGSTKLRSDRLSVYRGLNQCDTCNTTKTYETYNEVLTPHELITRTSHPNIKGKAMGDYHKSRASQRWWNANNLKSPFGSGNGLGPKAASHRLSQCWRIWL